MSTDFDILKRICKCLDVDAGKIEFNEENIVRRTYNGQTINGFCTNVTTIMKESKSPIAKNSSESVEIEAQVYQWIEFFVLYVAPGRKDKHIAQQLLRDFDRIFLKKSYLVGQFITVADIVIYYGLYDLMKSLTPLEKETHLNLSRWFDHIQQWSEVRQDADPLNFTSIFLHVWATGTHL